MAESKQIPYFGCDNWEQMQQCLHCRKAECDNCHSATYKAKRRASPKQEILITMTNPRTGEPVRIFSSVEEASTFCNIPKNYIYRAMKHGKISYHHLWSKTLLQQT